MSNSNRLRLALDTGDIEEFSQLLKQEASLAHQTHSWGLCSPIGAGQPIAYLAQARFNGFIKHDRSGAMTRMLLASGAPVNGAASDKETPLITAASYNEPAVACALIEAGANLEATGYAVTNGTALAHAIEFGAIEIVDLLVAAGASIRSLHEAAGTGNLPTALLHSTDEIELAFALRSAALCNRLHVMDELLAAGIQVNQLVIGATALHWAAWQAKAAAARHLVSRGADPMIKEPEHQGTPLDWARHRSSECPHAHPGGHFEVIQFLESAMLLNQLTPPHSPDTSETPVVPR